MAGWMLYTARTEKNVLPHTIYIRVLCCLHNLIYFAIRGWEDWSGVELTGLGSMDDVE